MLQRVTIIKPTTAMKKVAENQQSQRLMKILLLKKALLVQELTPPKAEPTLKELRPKQMRD